MRKIDIVKEKIAEKLLNTAINETGKSVPTLIYEVPKPEHFDELVKKVQKEKSDMNF